MSSAHALGEARSHPVVEQCFLWQPAVAEHALADDPGRDPSPLAHEHFPAAHRGARRLVVLHSTHDGVLGPRPAGQPDDPDSLMEDTVEELGGVYPHKYRLDGDLRQRYFPGAGGRVHSRAIRAALIENLAARLQREAELAAPTERQARGEAPLYPLRLLAPWAREYRFSPEELQRITTRLQALLEERLSVPNEVAPAMGWSGPLIDPGSLESRLEDLGQLEVINQRDLLTTHSGMKWPNERLFEEIVVNILWKRYLSEIGFGEY